MKRTPLQKMMVLRMLRLAGSRGITQLDADRPPSGPPIRRLASRVHELIHDDGHRIEVRGKRNCMAVYVLVEQRSPAQAAPAAPIDVEQAADALFSPPVPRPYDLEDVA